MFIASQSGISLAGLRKADRFHNQRYNQGSAREVNRPTSNLPQDRFLSAGKGGMVLDLSALLDYSLMD